MLKIKDNIDLKELEKFGFEKNENENKWVEKWIDDTFRICVLFHNKYITVDCVSIFDCEWTLNLDIIYDLIKADLVEKVEE